MRILSILILIFLSLLAKAQIDEIKDLLKQKPPNQETAIWLCDTAFSMYSNDPALAEEIAKLALEKAELWNSEYAKARANHVIGISLWARDMYDIAIEYYLQALESYEKLDVRRGIATIGINIGSIYDDLGQSARGKPFLQRSIEILIQENDSLNLSRALNNLAILYSNLGVQDTAMIYFNQTIAIRKQMNDSIGIARIYNNIADVFLDVEVLNDTDRIEAQKFMNFARQYMYDQQDDNLLSTIYANLGMCSLMAGEIQEAKAYLDSGMRKAIQIDSKANQQLIQGYFRKLYEGEGNYEQAYAHLIKETMLDTQQRSAKINKQIDQLNIQYQTEQRERQLAEMERERAIDRNIRNNVIIISTSVVLFIILLYYAVNQKRKKDSLIAQLKLDKLHQELSQKNKEISSYTLNFLQKKQLVDSFKDQMSELKNKSDLTTNKHLSKINRILDETFKVEDEWKTFQLTFDQMHDDFFTRLKKAFPNLGNSELKLCALLRLNMNLKEAANVLAISPDSVKTARYRIRKKFGLKTEDNLVDFLLQFESQDVIS